MPLTPPAAGGARITKRPRRSGSEPDPLEQLRDDLEVGNESTELSLPRLGVAAEDRGRMDGGEHVLGQVRLHGNAALARDPELAPEQRLRGRRSEADEHARPDDLELRLEPGIAGRNLGPVWLLVDAPLAACDPLEVLDDVGQIDLLPVDARVCERLVEELPGRADERPAELVLLVAGLLADEHRLGVLGALAEHDLRPRLVEVARGAAGGLFAQFGEFRSGHAFAVPGRPRAEPRATMALAAPWPRG